MELLKLLAGSEIVAQIISFLVLLFVLKKFAWKGILDVLDQRKKRIAEEFERIEAGKRDIEGLKAEYAVKLNTADETARAKVQEAVNEARKAAEEITKTAREEAKEILENEKENIKQEIAKTKEEIKNQVVDLVMVAVERVVEDKLMSDPANDKKMVQDFLEKMDKAL